MSECEFKAIPEAGFELSSKIYELLNLAQSLKYVKKGVNETIKSINKGITEIVILSGDTNPLELLTPVVRHCEEHSIPYCFVDSQACLG
jgi:U4/U6 small nuclear ribonucleoprotein SNU13